MKAVIKRELSALRHSKWCALALFILVAGCAGASYYVNLYKGYADFEQTLAYALYAYIAVVPLITMDLFAGEKDARRLLRALPLPAWKLALGKLIAAIVPLALGCALLIPFPLALSLLGDISLKTSFCGIAGFFALGVALLSVGLLISALSKNRAIAFLRTAALLAVLKFLPQISAYFISLASGSPVMLIASLAAAVAAGWLIFGGIIGGLICGALLEAPMIFARQGAASALAVAQKLMDAPALFERYLIFGSGIFDWTLIIFFALFAMILTALAQAAFATAPLSERRSKA